MDIGAWLRGLGLERYEQAFRDNEVDLRVLSELTADDLKELGVAAIGHRRVLLKAIADFSADPGRIAATNAPAGPTAAASADAERRQLTVMFCDLVGSTSLATRLDLEDLRDILGAYHRCVADTVARFDGFVAKYMGDGVLAYFGYPQAHEDDAERAVRAGLAVIDAVRALNLSQPLAVRLGIASGLAVVGDLIGEGAARERGVVGETPNLAARLQALAMPNRVVIADGTRRQIGGLFEVENLGPQALLGFAEAPRAWQVVGESGVVSRFEALRTQQTALVGRDEGLDLLRRRWWQAKAGEGRVVLIAGEPGIGKSRLTAALAGVIASESHTRLRYFSSPHHQDSVLYPFIIQLERAAGFARDDTPEEKLDKLRALIADGAAGADEITLIAELLSLPNAAAELDLSPQRKREKLLGGLLHQLETLARGNPVLMVFEDAHWIDPTSRDLIDLMVDRIRRLPLLLLVTFRPEFHPPWADQPHVTALALNRLGERDGSALVEGLAGNASVSSELVAEIVERSDGVPLFIEELTKAVVEAGADRDALTVSGVPASKLAVPATLHASLLGRLDRLGPTAKLVAQAGAAIGREFSYDLVAAAAELAALELHDALQRLVGSGLVFQRGVVPVSEYLFKHALVQDTAYSTLLRGPRQALHRRIAGALEAQFPSLVEARPEIAAHHYGEAAMVDKAVPYWLLAGKLSVAKSAVEEAVAQLRRGLSLLSSLPETLERNRLELDLHIPLTSALIGARGYAHAEVAGALGRSRQLIAATATTGTPLHFSVLYCDWVAHNVRGNLKGTLERALQFLALAEMQPASAPRLIGQRMVGAGLLLTGDFRQARPHLELAASLYRAEEHREFAFRYGQDIGATALCYLSWALWHEGYPDRAARTADRALLHAREFGHAYTLAYTLFYTAKSALLSRDVQRVERLADENATISREHGFPLWFAFSDVHLGWAAVHQGQGADAIGRMRGGIAAASATGSRLFEPLCLGLVTEALAFAGEGEEGVAELDQALAGSTESGERCWDAELHRLRGDLVCRLPRPDPDGAERSFRAALSIAREQGTKGFELRAATSLARLLRDHGRRQEALELLAPVYDWFTEGFDTADLKDAKALLAELA
jgi:class 3 adenylate cyclase/predicted ATPase/energy-coupling factor transporter ATP-binding protein EcfA2